MNASKALPEHPQALPERIIALAVPACEVTGTTPAKEFDRRAQLWHTVHVTIQQVIPGATAVQPGWCLMRARGPARYYGSEGRAAGAILHRLSGISVAGDPESENLGANVSEAEGGATVGVADGSFAAAQAALEARNDPSSWAVPRTQIVPAGKAPDFLSYLPISRVADEELSRVLTGLGIHTLGAFAALPEAAVFERFGSSAHAAHRRARGLGELHGAEITEAPAPRDLSLTVEFEEPLENVEQVAFACAKLAEQFVSELHGLGLVCTELCIRLQDDSGEQHERSWSHPANFTAYDIVNRVRWQTSGTHLTHGLVFVQLSPVHTAASAAHEPGLWSTAPSERVHHQLTRVQSLIGHEGVGTGLIRGGRLSCDRQVFLPWGNSYKTPARTRAGPWSGTLQGSLPNLVFTPPLVVELFDSEGSAITVDQNEDQLVGTPANFRLHTVASSPGHRQQVLAWSPLWPLRERWWRGKGETFRLQVELVSGEAWLLRYERGNNTQPGQDNRPDQNRPLDRHNPADQKDLQEGWYAEGRYG